MNLLVLRYTHKVSSLGLFLIDRKFECYTLEDPFHIVKIPGETRIPEGNYRVVLRTFGSHHEKYKVKFPEIHKGMLQVMDVPNYTDILIYILNTIDDIWFTGRSNTSYKIITSAAFNYDRPIIQAEHDDRARSRP